MIALIKLQMEKQEETKLSKIESQGLINIMNLEKVSLPSVGNVIESNNVLEVSSLNGQPKLPEAPSNGFDEFINKLKVTTTQWIIVVDETDTPHYALDAHAVFKDLYKGQEIKLIDYCLKPLIFQSDEDTFLDVLHAIYKSKTEYQEKDSMIILFWKGEERRIVTNNDALTLISKNMFVSSEKV